MKQEKQMISLKELAIGCLVAIGVTSGVFVLAYDYAVKKSELERNLHRESCMSYAMGEYKPIGNGGALSEFSGQINEDRRKMYDNLHRRFNRCAIEGPNIVRRLPEDPYSDEQVLEREGLSWYD